MHYFIKQEFLQIMVSGRYCNLCRAVNDSTDTGGTGACAMINGNHSFEERDLKNDFRHYILELIPYNENYTEHLEI